MIRAYQTYQKSRRVQVQERWKGRGEVGWTNLEELTRTEPEAAAEKLAELDKVRIEERASLKHMNTLKFLQDQAKRPKMTKNQRN